MNVEEDLIMRMQADEGSAFKEFDRDYSGMINSFIYICTHNKTSSKDILAQIMVAVWQHITEFNSDSKFSTWIYTISIREAVAYLKKAKLPCRITTDMSLIINARFALTEQTDGEDPESIMIKGQKLIDVLKAIALLPKDQGIAITLIYFEGMTNIEAGMEMGGKSAGSVKQLLIRGKAWLAVLLIDYKEDYS
jgi:RNA polymerase sigma-70 factor (ECF subfamily)